MKQDIRKVIESLRRPKIEAVRHLFTLPQHALDDEYNQALDDVLKAISK